MADTNVAEGTSSNTRSLHAAIFVSTLYLLFFIVVMHGRKMGVCENDLRKYDGTNIFFIENLDGTVIFSVFMLKWCQDLITVGFRMDSIEDETSKFFDPHICWTTTYIQKIEYKDSKLKISFNASLLTSHPMFLEALIPAPDQPISIEYNFIFDGVSNFKIGDESLDHFELLTDENLEDDSGESYQIFDFQKSGTQYCLKFYELDKFTFEAQSAFPETGDYIFSKSLFRQLDLNIDWSLSSLFKIQIEDDIVFEIAACLNSWHPSFEKSKVKGHWGKYRSTLRFPNVKEYLFDSNAKAFSSEIEFTPDTYQILEIVENTDGYQISLGEWSKSPHRFLTIKSEPPIFEIGAFISSGPFIRSPYPPRINVPPHDEETISDLMGELKTSPKGSVSEWSRMALFFVPITFALLFLIARCTGN